MQRSIMGTNVPSTLGNLKVASDNHQSKGVTIYSVHSYDCSCITYKSKRNFHLTTDSNEINFSI